MKTLSTLGGLLAMTIAIGFVSACSDSEASPAELAKGEQHFMSTCASCHGADAMGLPKLGKGLHQNEFVREMSDSELVEFLKTGRSAYHPLNSTGVDMPPKGGNPTLNDEDLAAIVRYVRTLN